MSFAFMDIIVCVTLFLLNWSDENWKSCDVNNCRPACRKTAQHQSVENLKSKVNICIFLLTFLIVMLLCYVSVGVLLYLSPIAILTIQQGTSRPALCASPKIQPLHRSWPSYIVSFSTKYSNFLKSFIFIDQFGLY